MRGLVRGLVPSSVSSMRNCGGALSEKLVESVVEASRNIRRRGAAAEPKDSERGPGSVACRLCDYALELHL